MAFLAVRRGLVHEAARLPQRAEQPFDLLPERRVPRARTRDERLPLGGWTIHCGTDDAYIALYTHDGAAGPYAKGAPLNHVGLLVDDLDAAEAVVKDAGLEPFNHADYAPGRRFYFFDWDQIEWEVVSYA